MEGDVAQGWATNIYMLGVILDIDQNDAQRVEEGGHGPGNRVIRGTKSWNSLVWVEIGKRFSISQWTREKNVQF